MSEPWATVVIPTYNGATYLEDLLNALERQNRASEMEVLVIDSGSTDGSLAIIRSHPSVRLVEIPNSDFSHGRTRDRAARLARGRFVAYLTQDAVPADKTWLAELLLPFELNDDVVLVTGRQMPRKRAFPLQKYEIIGAFRSLGPDTGVTLQGGWPYPPTEAELEAASFHSDVNAAVRRSRVTSDLPFRDVPYSEDQVMGREVLESGGLKAYAGRAAVIHSNDLTLREYGQRVFDETVGLRKIGKAIEPLTRRPQYILTLRGITGDTVRILRDPDYAPMTRLRWIFVNPFFQIRKWSAYRRGSRIDLANESDIAASSLEARRKVI